jgi:hypothetical protein
MKNKNNKRSPLQDRPLNQAGQSLQIRLLETVIDKKVFPILVIIVLSILTSLEWLRLYFNTPNLRWLYTVITIIFTIYFLFYWKKNNKEIENIKLGLKGEEIVAEKLNDLRQLGYKVYNDVLAGGFNIDHVLIGPAGVFTIETKTYRKDNSKNCQIYYDGEKIKIDNFDISKMKDPIKQAKSEKYWLEKKLNKYFNNLNVRPVVVFPGWYINLSISRAEVMVCNENSLISMIKKKKTVLNIDQINRISNYIENYIRNS